MVVWRKQSNPTKTIVKKIAHSSYYKKSILSAILRLQSSTRSLRNSQLGSQNVSYTLGSNCSNENEIQNLKDIHTPWSRVLLEKLTIFQLVKKFPAFYGTRRFIKAAQVPATCSYPEPARSSPCPHIPLPEDPS